MRARHLIQLELGISSLCFFYLIVLSKAHQLREGAATSVSDYPPYKQLFCSGNVTYILEDASSDLLKDAINACNGTYTPVACDYALPTTKETVCPWGGRPNFFGTLEEVYPFALNAEQIAQRLCVIDQLNCSVSYRGLIIFGIVIASLVGLFCFGGVIMAAATGGFNRPFFGRRVGEDRALLGDVGSVYGGDSESDSASVRVVAPRATG